MLDGLSFVDVFKHTFSAQMVIRFFSFAVNFVLLRLVDPSLLGFFNVKMNLLYTTIGFLSREPIRKLCLGSAILSNEVPLYAGLSVGISVVTTFLGCLLWIVTWHQQTDLAIEYIAYLLITFAFALSAFMEALVEPIVILRLKSGNTIEYSRNNAILALTHKAATFTAVFAGINPFWGFPAAQIIGSLFYVYLYIRPDPSAFLQMFQNAFYHSRDFKPDQLKLLKSLMFHSILKQALTDGANYLMAFTNLLPLKVQAVYDAVDRLGSLFVRIVLQPFEESAAIYFGTKLRRNDANQSGDFTIRVPHRVAVHFILLTRFIVTFGMVVLAFGSAYSWLAAYLYGGQLFIENGAYELLFWYSIYLPVIAFNGISECFAFSMFSADEVLFHAKFFVLSVFVHLSLSYLLCTFVGVKGFIISNVLVYSIRLMFNWYFIHPVLSVHFKQMFQLVYRRLIPGNNFIMVVFLSWIIVFTSYILTSSSPSVSSQLIHLCFGAVMFALTAFGFKELEFAEYSHLISDKVE